jgi:hypothetical protein
MTTSDPKYKHVGWFQNKDGSYKRVFKGSGKKEFYKKVADRYVKLPRSTKVISIDNYKSMQEARGREVSVRDSAQYAQFVYGRMRVGGVYSFLDTSQDSAAYLVTGSGAAALLWTAKATGNAGNAIAIQMNAGGTNPTLSISVVGDLIVVNLKCSSSVPQSTRTEVITAIEADATANNKVKIQRTDADGNAIIQPCSITNLNYGGGTWLHHFISVAFHEIDGMEKVWLDDREVGFGASPDPRWAVGSFEGRVFVATQLGSESQTVQPDLSAQVPTKWTSDHRQQGVAGFYMITVYDQNVFPDGFPETEFQIRGKKVYDPRTGQTAWTDSGGNKIGQNAALILADYMTNTKYGMGIPWSKIDTAALNDSANCCDQDVALSAGGTEKRYLINGVFDTGMTHRQVIEEMLLAMAGDLVYQGGKWFIYAGKWRAPAITINEDDFRGPIKTSVNVSKRDSYNGVKGTIVDPSNNYQETEFPLVKNDLYIGSDGRENFMDIVLNCVHSKATAQRIAKIMLEKNRQSIEFSAPMSARLMTLKVSDTVYVNFSKYIWAGKIFEVKDFQVRYDPNDGIGCDMAFRETAMLSYSDTAEEFNFDPAPNTGIPNPYTVIAPSNLILSSGTSDLYLRNDGTVFSRLKVSWTAPNDVFVVGGGSFEIQYKKSSSGTWLLGGTAPANQTSIYILDVQDSVAYDVRVKAINTANVSSSWIESLNHTVLGKTEKPAPVSGFVLSTNDLSISLKWDRLAEPDVAGYRIKRSLSLDWDTATTVENLIKSTQYEDNFRVQGFWNYLIKAVDTSGNESSGSGSVASVQIKPPLPVVSFTVRVTNNIVLLDWEAPSKTSFPIAKYKVYKGSTFETSVLLGEAFVTFQAYTEQFAGSSYFWISAVDTGGNEGQAVGKLVNWYSPPNTIQYVFNAIDAESSELSSAVMDETIQNSFLAPVKVDDSWSLHFSRNGWSTVGDQAAALPSDPFISATSTNGWIDEYTDRGWTTVEQKVNADYLIWIEPSDSEPGYFTRTIDMGVLIQSARIEVSTTQELLDGSVTVETYIATSADLITWIYFAEGSQVLASSFRWVRIQIKVIGADDKSLMRIGSPTISIGVRELSSSGRSTTGAAGSVTVNIGNDFLSLENIQLTAAGGAGREVFPVFNYATQNPTSFEVLGYISGSPGAVDFNWTVRGATGSL